jgi:site-specific recombinase XerD
MFCKDFRAYARRVGIREEVSAYSLRHGFCCQALERGVGARQIADVLGQATTRQIDWYGRGTRKQVDYLRENVTRITEQKRTE